jgi:hypothetical protein
MGFRLRPVFSSDFTHFDVPNFADVIPEAFEMVEKGFVTEQDFRKFTFTIEERYFRSRRSSQRSAMAKYKAWRDPSPRRGLSMPRSRSTSQLPLTEKFAMPFLISSSRECVASANRACLMSQESSSSSHWICRGVGGYARTPRAKANGINHS